LPDDARVAGTDRNLADDELVRRLDLATVGVVDDPAELRRTLDRDRCGGGVDGEQSRRLWRVIVGSRPTDSGRDHRDDRDDQGRNRNWSSCRAAHAPDCVRAVRGAPRPRVPFVE
jgi:hypothetical protein